MATRILILTPDGTPLYGLDGHHGATHAARWVDDVLAQLAAAGVADPLVLELEPEEGGDACRHGIIGCIHAQRLETRRRPDGAREILGLNRIALPEGQGDADAKRAAAATPTRVGARLHLVRGPAEFAAPRRPIRIPRGRMEPLAGAPATPAQARIARRLARRSS